MTRTPSPNGREKRLYVLLYHDQLPQLAKIGGHAISVYVAIKSFAGADGSCFPKLSDIQTRCGVSIGTIRRTIAALVDAGLLRKTLHNTKKGRTGNRYQFTEPSAHGAHSDGSQCAGCALVAEPSAQGAHLDGAQCAKSTSPVRKIDEPSAQGAHPSRTTEVEPIKKQEQVAPANASTTRAPSFDEFWELYPPRDNRKREKAKARTTWNKLSVVDQRKALQAAPIYAAEESYIKDAFRWLRDRSFEDYLTRRSKGNGRADSEYQPLQRVR